jgi:hypothetical protein
MGLYVHSLGEIPNGAERAYYVYLLDYGWEEPLGSAVRANLPRMADLASRSDAIVIHGPRVCILRTRCCPGTGSMGRAPMTFFPPS